MQPVTETTTEIVKNISSLFCYKYVWGWHGCVWGVAEVYNFKQVTIFFPLVFPYHVT